MKLVTYRSSDGDLVGVVDADRQTVRPLLEPSGDLLSLIRDWPAVAPALVFAADPVPLAEVELRAPLQPRRDVFCVGKNYQDHSGEFARSGFDATGRGVTDEIPEHPIVFTKSTGSVVGPGAPIDPHLELTESLDYEIELGVIIGKAGRGIAAADVPDHVWGYTIVNDVTARDLQRAHRQWYIGKSLDTFCPLGPWAVTADEVDVTDLAIRCWVNGELRQDGHTRDLIFDVPTLVSTISAGITLHPGDVLATGTPAGVGIGFDPPRFLRPGDVVEGEITQLGRLVNRVAGA